MTGIKLRNSKCQISAKEFNLYDEYFTKTYDYIAKELNLDIRSIGGKSFDFSSALAFRFIIDNSKEISLDRSIELRVETGNNTLYLDTIAGSIKLTTLTSAKELKEIVKKLSKFHFKKHNDKIYTATVDVLGYTLPDKANYENSEDISSIVSNLPIKIFENNNALYSLTKILRDPITIEFHSSIYEGPEIDSTEDDSTSKIKTDVAMSTDGDRAEEITPATTNNDKAETEVEAVEPTDGNNSRRIEIVSITNSSTPTESITIGERNTEDDSNKEERKDSDNQNKNPSTSTSDDNHSIEVALPTQTLSWGQWVYSHVKYSANWAYDNIYPIAGTAACIGGAYLIYYYNQPHDLAKLDEFDQLRIGTGMSRPPSPQDNWMENSELSISQRISDAGSDIIESARDKFNEVSFRLSPIRSGSFPKGFGSPQEIDLANRLACTPQASTMVAQRTAQKVKETVRFIDQEQQIFNEAAKEFARHFKVSTSPWLAKGGKDTLQRYVKNFFEDASNLGNLPAAEIKQILLNNFRSDYTLDYEDFLGIINNIGRNIEGTVFTLQDAARDLNIQSVFGNAIEDHQVEQASAEGLLRDILQQTNQNKYILYIAIMSVFPFVNSEEENPEELLNNNANEWHSISMVTESDLDDNEDSEGYVVNYNNTHPELVLKAFSQAIEDSYKKQDNFELNFISDTGIQCRSVLNNAIEILADTLYLTAHMTKGSNPLVTLFNNFYVIPELYSSVDSICDSVEESLDNAYLAAEESYDSALELLGIEASA